MKPSRGSRTNDLLACLVVAAAYVAAGVFGLSLASVNKSASAVWPPTGSPWPPSSAWGIGIWPGILAGASLVNFRHGRARRVTSLGIAVGNTLEGALGCYLVRRFAGGVHVLERPSTIFAFTGLASAAAAVSAGIGVATAPGRRAGPMAGGSGGPRELGGWGTRRARSPSPPS